MGRGAANMPCVWAASGRWRPAVGMRLRVLVVVEVGEVVVVGEMVDVLLAVVAVLAVEEACGRLLLRVFSVGTYVGLLRRSGAPGQPHS